MSELENLLKRTIASGLQRKSISTPSAWARAYRVMGQPFPGAWTPRPAPWTLGMHDSEAPLNVGQKGAQLGFSETVLDITFYKIDIERVDCLYALPNKMPDASEFSSARFDAALELSTHLNDLFSNVKNVGHKRAGSANLYVCGSNSRSAFKSKPVGLMVFDELDEMNLANVILAEERTSGQRHSETWKISTPTIPNFGINEEFLASTQEHWVFKCPHCSKRTELIFPDCLIITAEAHSDPRIKESHLICKECKHPLDHKEKMDFLGVGNAEWVPFGDPQIDVRGFYVNQLYSIPLEPWKIARLYLRSLSSKPAEQEFWNSKIGLPHLVEGSRLNKDDIEKNIGQPVSGKIVTMGVDQGKWLHYEIASWHFKALGNDINISAVPHILKIGKAVDFEELDVLMKEHQVQSCVIDAQPEKRLAYAFACRFWGHVKLCYYAKGLASKRMAIDSDEDEHKITADRTYWLDMALNRFRTNEIVLPIPPQEYKDHLQQLVRRYKIKDDNQHAEYVSLSDSDHYAHARAYNEMALPLGASLVTNRDIRVYL